MAKYFLLFCLLYLNTNLNFILITSLYNEQNPERVEEYLTCLKNNLEHELIDIIHVIYDGDEYDESSPILEALKVSDVRISYINGRPTYCYGFNLANLLYPGEKIILSNADIYFNTTLSLLEDFDLTDKFLALTRWNVLGNGSLKPYYLKIGCKGIPQTRSQDTWIFKTPLRNFINDKIEIGTWHCDGRIAYEARRVKLRVINPCQSIQCCHLHNSSVRNYSKYRPQKKMMIPVRWTRLENVR